MLTFGALFSQENRLDRQIWFSQKSYIFFICICNICKGVVPTRLHICMQIATILVRSNFVSHPLKLHLMLLSLFSLSHLAKSVSSSLLSLSFSVCRHVLCSSSQEKKIFFLSFSSSSSTSNPKHPSLMQSASQPVGGRPANRLAKDGARKRGVGGKSCSS